MGIAGATGYAGQELVALLARHPNVDLRAAMSSSADSAARPMPRLARVFEGHLEPLDAAKLSQDVEVAFLAVPENAAADLGATLVSAGVRVIDLSGAFRIRDDAQRHRWYPATKTLPEGVAYGLVEHYRDDVKDARLVACPGTHFSENHGSVSAYGLFGHRHAAEMEQELGTEVTFVPHLVPLDRGILETIYVKVAHGTRAEGVADAFESAYGREPFVRLTGEALPEIKHVAWTNFCDIGWRLDPGSRRLVIVACLDNLVKGAAGQAIQNFNVACGFDERTALL